MVGSWSICVGGAEGERPGFPDGEGAPDRDQDSLRGLARRLTCRRQVRRPQDNHLPAARPEPRAAARSPHQGTASRARRPQPAPAARAAYAGHLGGPIQDHFTCRGVGRSRPPCGLRRAVGDPDHGCGPLHLRVLGDDSYRTATAGRWPGSPSSGGERVTGHAGFDAALARGCGRQRWPRQHVAYWPGRRVRAESAVISSAAFIPAVLAGHVVAGPGPDLAAVPDQPGAVAEPDGRRWWWWWQQRR
jgi:hypothetical protein